MRRYFADLTIETAQAVAQAAVAVTLALVPILVSPLLKQPTALSLLLLFLPLFSGSRYVRTLGFALVGVSLTVILLVGLTTQPYLLLFHAFLTLWALRFLTNKRYRTSLRYSSAWGDLGRQLPRWQAFPVRESRNNVFCRILCSPDGTLYFVALGLARETKQYGNPTLLWDGVIPEMLPELTETEPVTVRRAPHVMWLRTRSNKLKGYYPLDLNPGIVTCCGAANGLATSLQEGQVLLSHRAVFTPPRTSHVYQEPKANPASDSAQAHTTPRSEEDSVQASERRQAITAGIASLRSALPGDWTIEEEYVTIGLIPSGVLLHSPTGKRFLIDLHARRDVVQLGFTASKPTTWQLLHDALEAASRAYHATPILWQPLANDDAPATVGRVYNVRGVVDTLLGLLFTISPAPRPQGRSVAADLELLGLHAGATHEEIRAAYRLLIKRHHPDKVEAWERQQAEETTKKLNAAYTRLTGYSS